VEDKVVDESIKVFGLTRLFSIHRTNNDPADDKIRDNFLVFYAFGLFGCEGFGISDECHKGGL
jgi:hypothetical protein